MRDRPDVVQQCGLSALDDSVVAGRYELQAVIGRGATGVVYRGHDRILRRDVAIKVLHPDVAGDETASARFQKGARLAARINHPNAVAIFDTGVHEGQPFVVMECLSGETLAARLTAQPLPCAQVRDIAAQLLGALSAAHRRGVIHRDIKPANVLLTPTGAVKVVDFGIATASDGNNVTGPGFVIGSLAYLAPERLQGAPATPQSDIYAAGVVIYEALTGRKPFHADTPVAMLEQMAQGAPTDLTSLRPDADARLTRVVTRALQVDPKERYATAAAMAHALERRRRVKRRSSLPPPPPTPTIVAPIGERRRPRRSRRAFISAVVALVTALCVGGAFAFYGNQPSHPTPTTSPVATQAPSPSLYVAPLVSTTVVTTTVQTTTQPSSTTVQTTTTRPTTTTVRTTTTTQPPTTTATNRTSRGRGRRNND